jgi:hypothetical protein
MPCNGVAARSPINNTVSTNMNIYSTSATPTKQYELPQ